MDRRGFVTSIAAVAAGTLLHGLLPPVPLARSATETLASLQEDNRRYNVRRYTMGYEVSHEMVQDDLYGTLAPIKKHPMFGRLGVRPTRS